MQYFANVIMQPALSSKNNKSFYKLKVVNNVSLKLRASDALRHKSRVNYKGVTESIFLLH